MNIEKQVCNIKQAIKLKELGIVQESQCYHYQKITPLNPNLHEYGFRQEYMPCYISTTGKKSVISGNRVFYEYSAFTVAEIGVMLKELCYCQFLSGEKNWISSDCGSFETYPEDDCTAKTMIESMTTMLIHQLENKIIEVGACNERLLA